MDLKSGYPFWIVKNGLLNNYPALRENIQCDVLVVGAGITGALIGWHLQQDGLDVCVIDRREAGWGSTAASTALLQYEIDTELQDLAERHGIDDAARVPILRTGDRQPAADRPALSRRRLPQHAQSLLRESLVSQLAFAARGGVAQGARVFPARDRIG